jgi:hypothetical protein
MTPVKLSRIRLADNFLNGKANDVEHMNEFWMASNDAPWLGSNRYLIRIYALKWKLYFFHHFY